MKPERSLVDAKIISTQEQLIPSQKDYTLFDYFRYSTSQNLSSWTANSTLSILAPKDPSAMIAMDESGILMDFQIKVSDNNGNFTPMQFNSSFVPVENFLDSIFSKVTTSYGSTNFTSYWSCSDQTSVWASGIYRLFKTKERVGGGYLQTVDRSTQQSAYGLTTDPVVDPLVLSLPNDLCCPDNWIGSTPQAFDLLNDGNSLNANAVYRHHNITAERQVGNNNANMFEVFWKPYTPEWRCLDRKLPHLVDIQVDLKRAANFNVSYQGNPNLDITVEGGSQNAVYSLNVTKMELWLSKYKLTNNAAREIQQILLSGAVFYRLNKVNVFTVAVPQTADMLQYTVIAGTKPDMLVVAFVRQQQLSGFGAEGGGAIPSYDGGPKSVPALACAPLAVGTVGNGGQSELNSKYFYPSKYVSQIQVTCGARQYPQIAYTPDTAPTPYYQTASTGIIQTATQLCSYDRAYEVFAREMIGCGYGHVLKNINKACWQSYLRLYVFNLTDDNAEWEYTGTTLTDRQNAIINANFLNVPSSGPPSGPGNVMPDPVNNSYQMIAMTFVNQAVMRLSPTGEITQFI